MIQRKGYRFRLEPDGGERQKLARFGGAARWVWNQALAEQKARLAAGERSAGYAEMCRWLALWRHAPETAWLAQVHSQVLQQALKDLDRAILDQGWGAFRSLLAYKLAERGGKLVLVDPKYTSQRCSECGHTCPENRPSQAVFACVRCGLRLHADHNAARNILRAAGYAVSACGGIGQRPPDDAGTRGEAA